MSGQGYSCKKDEMESILRNVERKAQLVVLILIWILMCCFALTARSQNANTESAIVLKDVTSESGVAFVHNTGSSGQGYLVEGVVGGLALFDFDNDGLIDIFFTNGAPLRGSKLPPKSHRHALYRNLGNMKFEDVTEKSGLLFYGYGLGAVAADYDNDKDQDLFISCFGKNALFRNKGNGTFEDVTVAAGVEGREEVSAGACFVDVDRDGWLDLFVASYVDFTYENHVPFPSKGQMLMAGPNYYPHLPDTLYRNRGDGTFEDVSRSSRIGNVKGPGMGVVAGDFDDDGDADIFVAQDGAPNLLFQNDGKGQFEEVALLSGVACGADGKIAGSMGVDCADFDNDAAMDFFVTNYQSEIPVLYRNMGRGLFEDASRKARIPTSLFPHVNWGTSFADFDCDGMKDVFIANGHFDRVEQFNDRTAKKVANVLLRQINKGQFEDVSAMSGSGMEVVESSRGIGVDDLDNDGDLDIVVLNSDAAPTIIRNDSPRLDNHWLQLELEGGQSNKDGVGAKIRLFAGDKVWAEEKRSGRGYQSHFGSRITFGLGKINAIEKIEIQWQNGRKDVLNSPALDRLIRIEEGRANE